MRKIQCFIRKSVLVLVAGALGACSDAEPTTPSSAPSLSPTDAPTASRTKVALKNGVRFTIDGPVFGKPTSFVVPGGREHLSTYLSDNMFNIALKQKAGVRSEDGKHVLDMLILGTEPAGKGEFTEASNVSEFSLGFIAHADTPQSESVSMSFRSKGIRQPVRLVVERYDAKGSSGNFTARLRRSNIKSTDQFYEVSGEFLVGD